MENFEDYLASIENVEHRSRVAEVLEWVRENYPQLDERIGWNHPMFTNDGTYTIGFSTFAKNMAISPEVAGIEAFKDEIVQRGYTHTQGLWRVPWDMPVDYELLGKMIDFQVEEKAGSTKFWR